jgi:hypothetical protein
MPRKAYCLSVVGYNILNSKDKLRIIRKFNKSEYKISMFAHTINCIKSRIIFQKHPYVKDYRSSKVITYYANKENKILKGKLFDAEMYVQGKDRVYIVGLEIELTLKKWTSYFNNITNIYQYRPELDYICWICSTQTIIDLLLSTIEKVRNHLFRIEKQSGEEVLAGLRKYRFILLDQFQKDRLKSEWIKPDGTRNMLLPEV